MKKRELCSFGKKINHRLIALEQSKGWLIEEVKRHNTTEQQIRHMPTKAADAQHEQPAPVCLQDGFQVE